MLTIFVIIKVWELIDTTIGQPLTNALIFVLKNYLGVGEEAFGRHTWVLTIIGFALATFFVFLVGILVATFVGKGVFRYFEKLFAAIPVIPEDLEIRRDSDGAVHLRLEAKMGNVRKTLSKWLKQDHSRKLALDETGTIYYNLADGIHPLREIVDAIVEASGNPRKDVEEGIILFTKKLMIMNMIVLKIPSARAGVA